jgi:phytoene synthase
MEFQAKRAREYYHQARALLRPDERMTMVAAQIMDAIYYRLLEKIELNDYRIFNRRISVSTVHKVVTALRIWLGAKLFVKRLR